MKTIPRMQPTAETMPKLLTIQLHPLQASTGCVNLDNHLPVREYSLQADFDYDPTLPPP